MQLTITKADTADSVLLSALAVKAKSHWDYPQEWIELWKEDLTISSDYIVSNYVIKALDSGNERIAGTCAIEQLAEKELELAHFWVDPDYMGKGVGRQLMVNALEYAEQFDTTRVEVLSDPNASEFYKRFGFRQIGEREGNPKGRFLPVLEKALFQQ